MKPHRFTSSREQLAEAADALRGLPLQIHQSINALTAEHRDYAEITLAKLDHCDDHVSNSHNLLQASALLQKKGCKEGANALDTIHKILWETISTLSGEDQFYIHALLAGVDTDNDISTTSNIYRIASMLSQASGQRAHHV